MLSTLAEAGASARHDVTVSAIPAPADDLLARLRREEFARLDRAGVTYLDYTGSALYAESQLRAHHELLRERLFGNPHAEHAASLASTAALESARNEVLRFFGVDATTHEVCFTAGASAAIKLVAEAFPFGPRTPLLLSADNHNSMNGVREFARRAKATVRVIPLDDQLRLAAAEESLEGISRIGTGLVGFPAQSNFSGVRHPLGLVARARGRGHRVLLDAAAYVPSTALDLGEVDADFVAISFYKIFGYPTGLGALVARRDALAALRRPWFAGGTVRFASVSTDAHMLLPGHAGLEDGTPDYLSVSALQSGFALLHRVGMERLGDHMRRLTTRLLAGLTGLRHADGAPAAEIYGPPHDAIDRGGTVAFNLFDPSGAVIPYWQIEPDAREEGIAFRGGCFCNPGAAEAALRVGAGELGDALQSLREDFTPQRLSERLGRPAGALRASLGLASDAGDVDRALEFLRRRAGVGSTRVCA